MCKECDLLQTQGAHFCHICAGAYLRKIAPKITFYICYLLIISPGLCVLHDFGKITSRKLFKKSFLGRSHMGTLGAKTSRWRPGHVPYLPYPRYATTSMCVVYLTCE
jgi:hypothetical protein